MLKRAKIVVPDKGIEKLPWASEMSRGIACPNVTLSTLGFSSKLTSRVVVHPDAPSVVQLEPVNPFVHMQEHTSRATTLVPPFSQLSWFWHCPKAESSEGSFLLKTKKWRGTKTAAAMIPTTIRMTKMSPHSGRPQYFLLPLLPSASPLDRTPRSCWMLSWWFGGSGHEVNQLPTRLAREVAWAGGGNAASMSESPD